MKRLEQQAFDWSDDNCPCGGSQDRDGSNQDACVASDLMRGYIAGFTAARAEIGSFVDQLYSDYAALNGDGNFQRSAACRQIHEAISAIGEEEAPTKCIDCGTATKPGTGSARCPKCWEDRCGGSGGDGDLV